MKNEPTITKIKKFEETYFNTLDYDNNENGYCLIVRCHSKNGCKTIIELLKDEYGSRWSGDILTIDKEDYKKLIEKSLKLEIIDSL